VDRRKFLQYGTAAGLTVAIGSGPLGAFARGARPPARSVATGLAYAPVGEFPSGVLSGDPLSDGVILWTRIDPAAAGSGVDVVWEVADDAAFGAGSVVASGTVATSAATDHTVRAEVSGLDAGTTYWYRFTAGAATSPVGRTRTLPSGSVDRLRIAYFSCERFVHGYYTAHADLAALALDPSTDVDLVICLGDYVYEAGPADEVSVDGRVDPDAPQMTLEDFRRQYHLYRSDPDLQAMHAAYPFVGIFDNHDGLSSPADPSGPGAIAAFFEQMPVRVDGTDPTRQHRSLVLGDLAEIFLLDERQHRDPEPSDESGNALGTTSIDQPEMVEPGRTMLGAAQLDWLTGGLAASGAAWKILGSQLMFAPLRSQVFPDQQDDDLQRNAGRYVNLTQWDGYQAERRTIVDHIHEAGVADVIAIAGDTHFWTASEIPRDYDDPTSPLVLTEFGGSSITSANAGEMRDLPGNDVIRPVVAQANALTLRYMEVTTHGYGLIELTADSASVAYRTPASITGPTSTTSVLARFEVARGSATIVMVEGSDFMARPQVGDPTDPTAPTGAEPPADPAPGPAAPVAGSPAYTG
jgi:alkaline phosphatase D